ncbi:MAG: CARDB domain-containing protein, partial [Anaerolineales bacterium]
QALPDLVISAIKMLPSQPQAGLNFTLNVYIQNAGQAPSGDYDLAISIHDISRGATYPVGTFRNHRLQPGENIIAITSPDRRVNDPGSYQVHVEIQPFQFEDSNVQNNVAVWAFTVK